FLISPLIIASLFNEIDFFALLLADVTHPNRFGHCVPRHSMWTPKSYGPEFFQRSALRIHERIVVRNVIMGGLSGARLASNGMAFGRVSIHIDANDAGKESLVDMLRISKFVISAAFVTQREIEE